MRRQHPVRCALVRFVHQRCGGKVPASVCDGGMKDIASVDYLQFGDLEGLAGAIRANRPAVVQGARVPETCSSSIEEPDALLKRIRKICGHREVPVRVASSNAQQEQSRRLLYRFVDGPVPHSQWRLYRVLDEVLATAADCTRGSPRSCACYAASLSIEARLPELAPHLLPVMELMEGLTRNLPLGPPVPLTPVIYFGAGAQRTPLHFDPTENMTMILQGSKRFRLFPPSASSRLQPRGGLMAALMCWWSGIIPAVYSDIDAWNGQHPSGFDVELNAGDIMYLPAAWWHAVAGSPETNLSVVFVYEPVAG